MKTFKKVLATILCVVMVLCSAPLAGFVGLKLHYFSSLFELKAEAATYSGDCGNGLTWILNTYTNTLTIIGTGAMKNYSYSSTSPWHLNRSDIQTVIIDDGVTSVGDYSFYGCEYIKTVELPDSLTRIGKYSFYGCRRLASVTIPDSVINIGQSSFKFCDSITSIIVPDSVTSIDSAAFSECDMLTSVTIGNSVSSIDDHVFSNCYCLTKITVDSDNQNYVSDSYGVLFNKLGTELIQYPVGNKRTSYTIPEGVTNIGLLSFEGCKSLANVTLPSSVINIGPYAFQGCDSLTNVIIPDNVTNIEMCAFSGCESLTSIAIPNSVTNINSDAFISCDSLTNVTIGNSLANLGYYVFNYCKNLDRIIVDNNNMNYKSDAYGVLFNKLGTELIQYPVGNKRTSYTIPKSVTSIGRSAFSSCQGLTSITIHNNVTNIGYASFYGCDNLNDVYYSGTEEQWNKIHIDESFNEDLTNATIHFNSTAYLPDEPIDIEIYKNSTITLDKVIYEVKEPDMLEISGTITCPDGVEDLEMMWSFDELDIFGIFNETEYEIISETEKRFTATFLLKKAGLFKIYAQLLNGEKAECMVISYKEAVSAFIDEHYHFVKSDAYNDFVAEKTAQDFAEKLRKNPSYHWNNFISSNFFENYYDYVLVELLTNDTTKQSVQKELEKLLSSEYVDLTNNVFDFINKTYQDALEPISEKDFYLVFNSDNPKVYEDTAVYKAISGMVDNKELLNNIFDINELFGYAQKILDAKECAVEGLVDCVYYYAAVKAYIKADEEIKTVITKAVAKTDNSDLKESLERFASIDCDTGYLSFAETLYNKLVEVGRRKALNVCFELFDFERTVKLILNITLKDGTKLADKVVKVFTKTGTTVGTIAQYANAVYAGVSLGKAVSSLITKSDDYSLHASKCTHAGDLAEALLGVLNEAAANFKVNQTLENAQFFDAAFNLYKNTQVYAVQAAVDSTNAQSNSLVALLANKVGSTTEYLSIIHRYKYINCHNHDLTELINADYYYVDEKYSGNKVLRIACPVDVYVYDSKGNLALSIENDFVEIFDDRLDAFVLNSEKYICVPLDEEFEIKIVSTDDGEMDYSVFEFDENSERIREVSKENITLNKGKTFEGKINNILNTDCGNYNLTVTDTQEVVAMEKDVECVPATGISISKSEINLKVGQNIILNATITPINTTDSYAWISSDEAIVTVSESGEIKAIGAGKAYVIALVNDLIFAQCEVNVTELKESTVTWIVDGVSTQQTVTEGDIIIKPANPIKSGYKFVGWTPDVPSVMPAYDLTFTAVFESSGPVNADILKKPTQTTISYGDAIILHVDASKIPQGGRVEWTASNGNFSYSANGTTCEIRPEKSGDTTFTATIYDSNGNAVSKDEQTMTSKAGFFDKIIAFFKKLFGLTKTYPNVIKGIF